MAEEVEHHVEIFEDELWYVDDDCQKIRKLDAEECAELQWERKHNGPRS